MLQIVSKRTFVIKRCLSQELLYIKLFFKDVYCITLIFKTKSIQSFYNTTIFWSSMTIDGRPLVNGNQKVEGLIARLKKKDNMAKKGQE